MFTTFYNLDFFGSEHSRPLVGGREDSAISEGVRVLGVSTSKCSHSTTTRSYPCRFHSRNNDDLYLTNLSQILKIHVDFRVISQSAEYRHPTYQKSQNCAGSSKIAFLAPNNLPRRKKTSSPKIKIWVLCEYW